MPFIRPTYRVGSVLELSPERLRSWGVDALLLDVDCTLKRYPATDPEADVVAWLGMVRAAGVKLCLVSNGIWRRIAPLAERLDLPCVARALKPLPLGCRRAVRMLDAARSRTAMVGDQLFADVIAGNLAGVRTILVEAISPEEEPWFTRLKRPLERWCVEWMTRKQGIGA